MRKLVAALILAVLPHAAHAIVVYEDGGAWLAAVFGQPHTTVGTYPLTITRTDYISILDWYPSDGFTVTGGFATVSTTEFQPNFSADFFQAGSRIDECWDVPCLDVQSLDYVSIQFATPIYGFAGFGQMIIPVNDAYVYHEAGFIGFTDVGSELFMGFGAQIADPFTPTYLSNVIIAFDASLARVAVPEPSSIAILSLSLLGLFRLLRQHSS